MADVDRLFDEFAASYVRGEQPDVAAYLARAGDDAPELARLVEVFLRVAPTPEPSDEDVAVMHARLEGEPGLVALRRGRGQKVDEVVAALGARLGVKDVPRLRRYYQRLETGVLDTRPVDERVWEALRDVFAANVRAIVRPVTTSSGESAMAYYRRGGKPSPELLTSAAAAAPSMELNDRLVTTRADPSPAERDDLDRLFLGSD